MNLNQKLLAGKVIRNLDDSRMCVFTKKSAIFEITNFGGLPFCEYLLEQNNHTGAIIITFFLDVSVSRNGTGAGQRMKTSSARLQETPLESY